MLQARLELNRANRRCAAGVENVDRAGSDTREKDPDTSIVS